MREFFLGLGLLCALLVIGITAHVLEPERRPTPSASVETPSLFSRDASGKVDPYSLKLAGCTQKYARIYPNLDEDGKQEILGWCVRNTPAF